MLKEIEKGKYYCHDWGCGSLDGRGDCDCGHDAIISKVEQVSAEQALPKGEKPKEPEWLIDLRKSGFKFGRVDDGYNWKPKDRNLI